jgi:hypothetical protein
MSVFSQVKRVLVSETLPTSAHAEERLSNAEGLAVLPSDALSSVAYATQEKQCHKRYSMSKLLSTALLVAFCVISIDGHYHPATARSCVAATSCGRKPIQFIPGQRITIEVVNLTESIVELQKLYGTDPLPISPGQMLSFVRGGSTESNFSVVFWDATGLPLQVNILQPSTRTLRIEVRPGGRPPGDRSVYLKDDGRVTVL